MINSKFKNIIVVMGVLFLIFTHSNCYSQVTFRIEEISVNPNCGGSYCVRSNGFCITPIFNYSYPGNVNNQYPTNPSINGNCYNDSLLPDEIQFINVNLCNNTTFTVPLNGVVVNQNCDCLNQGIFTTRNFTATIQPDPILHCDYLIIVEY
jgi:hypothetical protein